MRLNLGHPCDCFPISAIYDAANSAHSFRSVPFRRALRLQLVNLCFDVEELHTLHPAINQPRNPIEKPQSKNIFVEKEKRRRSWDRKKVLPQPPPPLGLRSEQRWSQILCI